MMHKCLIDGATHKRIMRDLEVATERIRGLRRREETVEEVLRGLWKMEVPQLGGLPKFVGLRLDGVQEDGSQVWVVEVSYPDYDFRVKGTTALAAAERMREKLEEEKEEKE